MSDLADRYDGLARRAGDLGPIADRVRQVLRAGKRAHLLEGIDAAGAAYAPLAKSTLRKPRRSPIPLIPDGEDSGLIAGYSVAVSPGRSRLDVSAGWPGRDHVRYLRSGTSRMPRRDPGGFRDADRAEILGILSEHCHGSDR